MTVRVDFLVRPCTPNCVLPNHAQLYDRRRVSGEIPLPLSESDSQTGELCKGGGVWTQLGDLPVSIAA